MAKFTVALMFQALFPRYPTPGRKYFEVPFSALLGELSGVSLHAFLVVSAKYERIS